MPKPKMFLTVSSVDKLVQVLRRCGYKCTVSSTTKEPSNLAVCFGEKYEVHLERIGRKR